MTFNEKRNGNGIHGSKNPLKSLILKCFIKCLYRTVNDRKAIIFSNRVKILGCQINN